VLGDVAFEGGWSLHGAASYSADSPGSEKTRSPRSHPRERRFLGSSRGMTGSTGRGYRGSCCRTASSSLSPSSLCSRRAPAGHLGWSADAQCGSRTSRRRARGASPDPLRGLQHESRLRKPTRSGWAAGGRPPTRHARPLFTVGDSRPPDRKTGHRGRLCASCPAPRKRRRTSQALR
jgi:hypothetical protein